MSTGQYTVRELIKELQCYEKDAKVWLGYEGVRMEIVEVTQEEVLNENDIIIK